MTSTPDTDPRFAALGQLIDSIMHRLDDYERVLSDLATSITTLATRQEPPAGTPPQSWLLADEDLDLTELLADLATWLRRVYLWYPGTALPSCWAWHPWVIEELWCLRLAHASAYTSRSVTKASDWHERLRPGVTRRIRQGIGSCDLAEHTGTEHTPAWRPQTPLSQALSLIASAWRTTDIPDPPRQPQDNSGT